MCFELYILNKVCNTVVIDVKMKPEDLKRGEKFDIINVYWVLYERKRYAQFTKNENDKSFFADACFFAGI